jgi:hypothetical protein
MSRTRWLALLAALCVVAALPAVASAHGSGRGGDGPRGDGAGARLGNVPSRVASRIRRADRATGLAEERADDGETAKAASQLKAARRNLASALKSSKKKIGSDSGPASLNAVAGAQHRAIDAAAGLFDGQTDGDLVSAIDATLDAAIAGRDDALAAIVALDDGSAYARVVDHIVKDVADEREAIAEALSDDELTDAAKQSLTDADTALAATETAAKAEAAATTTTGSNYPADAAAGDDHGDCPGGHGDRRPRPDADEL